jgi:hypothetical protein
MKHYEIEDQDRIGKEIAKMLCLKKDRAHKDRYQTTWGNKTAIGIFNTIIKLAGDIEDGKEINA